MQTKPQSYGGHVWCDFASDFNLSFSHGNNPIFPSNPFYFLRNYDLFLLKCLANNFVLLGSGCGSVVASEARGLGFESSKIV